jgi:O-antigen/teichoic acid export membrane protein
VVKPPDTDRVAKLPETGRSDVGRGATAVVGMRAAALALNFGVALELGRTLGVSGFGAYAAGMALGQILSVAASFGGGPLVVRGVAAYLAVDGAALLRGLMARALQVVLAGTCLVGAGAAAVLLLTDARSGVTSAMLAGAALVPLLALAPLGQAALQGSQRMVAAFAPPLLGRPLAMLVLLAALAAGGVHVSATGAVLLQGAALGITLCVTGFLVRRQLAVRVTQAAPAYDTRSWARSGAALGVMAGLTTLGVNVGVTLAGAIASGREAGLLGAATRVSVVVILLAWATVEALQPTVAHLYAAREFAELQRIVTWTTRCVFGGTVLAALGAAVVAEPLLRVFGAGFEDGATALRWLCVAAVVNAVAAPNMTLLAMTEHERAAAGTAAAGVAVTAILCGVLIPRFGAAGGAAAYTAGSVVRNALASHWTLARLGIESTIRGARPGGLRAVSVRER